MVAGITGKYCAGKNVVADALSDAGVLVVDEDRIGHEALRANRDELIAIFGSEISGSDGGIDRRALGAMVFEDPAALSRLESVVHPWMVDRTQEEIRKAGGRPAAINAAILFKMKLHMLCDFVIIVRAPVIVRLYRALRRDALSVPQVISRFRSQRQLNRAPGNVDTVSVWNVGTRNGLKRRVRRLLVRKGMVNR